MDNTCTDSQTMGNAADDTLDPAGVIPFADEQDAPTEPKRAAAPACVDATDRLDDLDDNSMDDHAIAASVVDRELGLGEYANQARQGQYICPCCGMGATRVVRVRIVSHAGWAAVCAVCAASLLERLPGTIVGGMVKPSRKRRINPIRAKKHAKAGGQTQHAASQGVPSGGQAARGFRGRTSGGYRRAG